MGERAEGAGRATASAVAGPAPALLMIGGGALMGFTMLAVLIGRSEKVGLVALPPANVVERLEFRAEDQVDGSIALRDVADRHIVAWIRPGEDGFLRGTLRGLAQARQREGLGPEKPFSLTRYDDGRLALADEATGRQVPLEAFGSTNAGAFARLMPGPGAPATETR
ncbi:putative photosynthetic complex assembly protein [Methylobacterium sp. PvP062]|uniref:Photosynthetic complex assembly protein n=1 Tax=Methylobacterium radiotolerans TaxID=31998 RepID=A0ABV2NQS8_9HYPH|nr:MULTISPECIES: photosynthetic complex assembly protein PuhC [unclassified Methylobacterium]MBP2494415.1 putative photosynthetic complex assembly protein [Methylobacterium sp. PvP105]MBP2499211.1 putative photosynthetic complex assembly protein [Methylobacterium sp. PvP109]MCX7331427.1 photosynthetic complex assembly protein PuhC [Hyphomicrobiales bacterium]